MTQASCIIHSNRHVCACVFVCTCRINASVVLSCFCIWLITGTVDYYADRLLQTGWKQSNWNQAEVKSRENRFSESLSHSFLEKQQLCRHGWRECSFLHEHNILAHFNLIIHVTFMKINVYFPVFHYSLLGWFNWLFPYFIKPQWPGTGWTKYEEKLYFCHFQRRSRRIERARLVTTCRLAHVFLESTAG